MVTSFHRRVRKSASVTRASATVLVAVLAVASLMVLAPTTSATDISDRIHTYTLENGLRVIMLERRHAPVVHFSLMFDVGGVDEPPGLGGIAHMVEHMAAMGTTSIGSLDPVAERHVLEELEDVVAALQEAKRDAAAGADRVADIEDLSARFAALKQEAEALAQPYSVLSLLSANGAVGLNAWTTYDFTVYVVSLPSNRFELWARLYADVWRDAVYRYFYSEADVVKEERLLRTEDNPSGYLAEIFVAEAFKTHPYGRPLIGSMEEIDNYTARNAKAFWDAHYHPNRAVLAVAGDIDPQEAMAIIEKYFGGLAPGPEDRWDIPVEPPQDGERRITVAFDAQPQIMIGYHKPTYPHRDAYVFDVINAILTSGRTSRLFARMVNRDQIAASISTAFGPARTRYPNLFYFQGTPRYPHGPEELEQAFYEEIERLKTELVDSETLQKVQNRVRATFVNMLNSNDLGLVQELAAYELFLGGWRNLFEYPDIINSITAEEIRDVARRYLTEDNRTVAILLPERGDAQ